MNINTVNARYKTKRALKTVTTPIPGCIYTGDTGNSNWVSGMLIQVDGDEATIMDVREKKHTVILSTLRSLQAAR